MALTIPRLDLSKAAKFANLPDPYAYLQEEEEEEENKKPKAETVIEKAQVFSVCSSEWDGELNKDN